MSTVNPAGSWGTTLGITLLTLLLAMAGCAKSDSTEPASPTPNKPAAKAGGGDPVATGKAIFEANCTRCHKIDGKGGRMGPDLTHVGAEEEHTPEWVVEHVKNPRAHNPKSKMPSFAKKLDEQELQALGAFLASLK